MLTSMNVTVDDVNFYDDLRMLTPKVKKKLRISIAWIALLIHGFVPVKTLMLIVCDTAFYAIIWQYSKKRGHYIDIYKTVTL